MGKMAKGSVVVVVGVYCGRGGFDGQDSLVVGLGLDGAIIGG